MSKFLTTVMSFVPAALVAVNRIVQSVIGARYDQGEIILEVRLDHIEDLAA